MKWTVLAAVLFCAAMLVTSLAFMAVACYNLTSTQDLFPLPAVTEWRNYLVQLIVLCGFVILMSGFSCWGAVRRTNTYLATTILLAHFAALAAGIFYCNLISKEIADCTSETDPDLVRNRTLEEFAQHRAMKGAEVTWVPKWLDSVQKHSAHCCGVISYEDWIDFWPDNPNQVPRSCCKTEDHCINDFQQIDWPEKPSDYIKNDEGCALTMILSASKKIGETLKFLIVLIAFIACSILAFLLLFILNMLSQPRTKENLSDNNNNNNWNSICFAWARVKFQRKVPNKGDGTDPNANPDDAIMIEQITENGSYSFTYLQQLKQQQMALLDQQQQLQPDTTGPQNDGQNIFSDAVDVSNQPPPQAYTYEVLPDESNNMYNAQEPAPLNVGSSQSLPEDTQLGNPQDSDPPNPRMPIMFPDDSEKQNLKQLLRFGRRHRRHRKSDVDPERQQQ